MSVQLNQRNPFPGLRPFTAEEDYLFFGREKQTIELLQRLNENRLVAVVGTSGSGKSSLVRCGLLSELLGGKMLQAGASWEIAVTHPGGNPLALLTEAILDADLYDMEEEHARENLLATLNRSHFGLVEAVRQAGLPADTNFLLIVDQFEEIFRFHEAGPTQQEMASEFVSLLLEAVWQTEVPVYVVLTMRSDFIGECGQFEGLAEMVNRGEFLIPRLNREQYKRIIEGPIKVTGGQIAPRLLQRLLNDLGNQPDHLPCLQHALMRTWDVWKQKGDSEALDLDDYQRVGKMAQALSLHADEIYESLASDHQRELCRGMFQALTVQEAENRGIRRPQRLGRLCQILEVPAADLMPVINAYRQTGVTFLIPTQEVELTDQTIIDISHESLMRVWVRLRHWVEEEAQAASIYRRLSESVALYQQGKAGLLRDPELGIALAWHEEKHPNQAWAEQYQSGFADVMEFLEASRVASVAETEAREAARQRELAQARELAEAQSLRAEEQQRAAVRMKGFVAALAVVAVLAAAALVAAMFAGNRAVQNARRAMDAEQTALAEARKAESARTQESIAREDAERQRELARRSLYVAQINAAHRLSQTSAGPQRLERTLAQLRPSSTESDLRGWEWYYLNAPWQSNARIIPAGNYLIAVDYSQPDGKRLVYGGVDGDLVVWDRETQRTLFTIKAHDNWIIDIDWSPNGQWIASTGSRGLVKIWDADTGLEHKTLDAHSDYVGACWSPDSAQLCTSSNDGKAFIWDVATGTRIRDLTDQATMSIDWSPDGNQLAIALRDGAIKIWELSAENESILVESAGEEFKGMDWSPDSTRLAIGDSNGGVRIWNTMTGKRLVNSIGHSGEINRVRWSPDGRFILVGSDDNTASVLNADTGQRNQTLRGHAGRIHGIAWHPNSVEVATASLDGRVILWDLLPNGAEREVWAEHSESIEDLAWSPDGRRLATVGRDRRLIVWDSQSGTELYRAVGHGSTIRCIAWSPDGRWLATGDDTRTIRIWDADTGTVHNVLSDNRAAIRFLAWSPDSWQLAAATGQEVLIWNLRDDETLAPMRLVGHGGRVNCLAWSPDGKLLVSGGNESPFSRAKDTPNARIWDAVTGEQIGGLTGEPEEVIALDWSPDAVSIASAGTAFGVVGAVEARVRVWNVESRQQVAVMTGHSAPITSIQWRHDGSRLLSSSLDGSVRVWDPQTGDELLELAEEGQIVAASWNPDGLRIASATVDGKIRLYDAYEGFKRDLSEALLPELNRRVAQATASVDQYALRARIHALHGRWEQAARDFESAAEMTAWDGESTLCYFTPWWVSGRFSSSDDNLLPDSLIPGPFESDESDETTAKAAQETAWRPVFPEQDFALDLRQYFDSAENMACFVSTRIYSPKAQQTALLLGSDDQHRVWFNGELVSKDMSTGMAISDSHVALITLRPGWNDLMAAVGNEWGAYTLFARVSNDARDLAKAFERSGEFETALEQWNRVLEKQPDKLMYLLHRAQTAEKAGRFEVAVADLTAALEQLPDNLLLVRERARLLQRLQRWEELRADLQTLVRAQPDDWQLRIDLGRCAAHLSTSVLIPLGTQWRWWHLVSGIDPAGNAPGFQPPPLDHPAELVGRGLAFKEAGFPELAAADFQAAIALTADEPQTMAQLLMEGITTNDLSFVSTLIENGVDVNLAGEDGSCALHTAARLGLPNMVRLLLDHSADVDRTNHAGNTPLHEALASFPSAETRTSPVSRSAVVRAILEHQPDLTIMNRDGQLPLEHGRAAQNRILSLAEVQVFSDGRNIALKGEATQSSEDYGGLATRAIDGDTNGIYNQRSVTHTKREIDPWWELDLGSVFQVDRIVVWDRTDPGVATLYRLANYRVELLDESRKVVWQIHRAEDPEPSHTYSPGRRGRYVRIGAPSTEEALWSEGGTLDWARRQTKQFIAEGQLDKAIDSLSSTLKILPDDPQMHRQKADLLGRSRRWDAALAELKLLLDLQPTNDFHVLRAAPLFIMTGDHQGYRQLCRTALDRFTAPDDPTVADKIAKACLLLPDAVEDLGQVNSLAALAMAEDPEIGYGPYFETLRGLADCRSGEFARAIQTLERNEPFIGDRKYLRELNLVVLAMACVGSGEKTKAAHYLAEARQTIDKALSSDDLTDWHDLLIAHILSQEVRKQLKTSLDVGENGSGSQ